MECFIKQWSSSVVKFMHEWDRTAAAQRVELEERLHREQECSKETQQALSTCRTEMKEKVKELTISISRITREDRVYPVYSDCYFNFILSVCYIVIFYIIIPSNISV